MAKQPYLYGANIQGIQSFIFATGKLKEIIGASELIERWCSIEFCKQVGAAYEPDRQILGAAGRIRYLFPDRESCAAFVHSFGKDLRSLAPNLRLSEAVVKLSDNFGADVKKLDQRLRAASNRYPKQHGLGWMIAERSRRTALPATATKQRKQNDDERIFDRVEAQKICYFNQAKKPIPGYRTLTEKLTQKDRANSCHVFPDELGDITGRRIDEWIAIVHADGNSMGQRIGTLITALDGQAPMVAAEIWRAYSQQIDRATQDAAQAALAATIKAHPSIGTNTDNQQLPLRPVLLGGDDITLIIRGDLALTFTNAYLQFFQEKTKAYFQQLYAKYGLAELKEGLTACAGISYIKYNYPFHYGADLAEQLTKYAKKNSKDLAKQQGLATIPASLAFHRVQSSFVGKYSTIREQQLTVKDYPGKDKDLYFNYGPYFLEQPQHTRFTTTKQLANWVKAAQHDDAPTGNLREWLSELHHNPARAQQQLKRIQRIQADRRDSLDLAQAIRQYDDKHYTHLFDVITLADIRERKPRKNKVLSNDEKISPSFR